MDGHNCTLETLWESMHKARKENEAALSGAAETLSETYKQAMAEGTDINNIDVSKLINTKYFTDPDAIETMYKSVVSLTGDKLTKTTKVANSVLEQKAAQKIDATVSELADIIGTDDKTSIAANLLRGANSINQVMVEQIIAKNFTGALAKEIEKEVSMGAAMNEARVLDLAEGILRIEPARKQVTSAGGRLLQSFKIKDNLSNEIVDTVLSGDKETLLNDIKFAKNSYAIRKVIANAGELLTRFRINSMLAAPITASVNATGNFLQTMIRPINTAIGAGIMRDGALAKNAIAQYFGMARAIGDSVRLAGSSLLHGPILRGEGSTMTALPTKGILNQGWQGVDELLTGSAAEVTSKVWNFGLKNTMALVNTAIDAPSTLLGSMDELFLQVNYRGKLWADAVSAADEAGIEFGSKEFNKFVNDRFNVSISDKGKALPSEMGQDAMDYSTISTFSQDLDNYSVIGGAAQHLQSLHSSKNPVVSFLGKNIFSFVRTPANLIQEAVDYTPGLNMVPRVGTFWKQMAKGGEHQAEAIGKVVTGAALGTIGFTAAMSGNLTGSGPTDPAARALLKQKGWQPYSIVTRDANGKESYFSLSRLDPWSKPLSLLADAGEHFHEFQENEWEDFTKAVVLSTTQNFVNRSYLSGGLNVADMLDGINSGDTEAVERYFANFAASFVPNYAKDIENLSDPYYRKARGLLETVMARVPGYSSNVPIDRDPTGMPTLSPVFGVFTKASDDPVDKELMQFAKEGISFPKLSPKYGAIDMRDFKDKSGKSAFEKYGDLVFTEKTFKGKGGQDKTLREELADLIKDSTYKNLSSPYTMNDKDYRGGKYLMMRDVISAAHQKVFLKHMMSDSNFKNAKGQSIRDAVLEDTYAKSLLIDQTSEEEQPPAPEPIDVSNPDELMNMLPDLMQGQ